MSKHRHKHKHYNNSEPSETEQNSPINFDNISQMLNNIDQDQIRNLMNSLNLNTSSLNTQNIVNEPYNESIEVNNVENSIENSVNEDNANDPGVSLLNAIRPMLTPDKIQILDRIIEIYKSGAFDSK